MTDDIMAGITLAAARRRLADAFRRAGLDTPELDARVLVAHALGVDQAAMLATPDRRLSQRQAADIATLASRRLARAPVARLVGAKEFWGLEFRLNAATLVPRPESETVVETALAAMDEGGSRRRPLKIADLGTGSGALLVALLSELPNATGVGTDVSSCALTAARDNAVRLGCGNRAAFVACDVGAALAGGFDLVVCNPPYIRSGDIAGLAPEVRDYDPAAALDGGPDALSFYRVLSRDAGRLVGRRGRLVVELGAGAADEVAHVFAAAGFAVAPARADLAGIARALVLAYPECV
jgi:release factor glutamine methyltransferase